MILSVLDNKAIPHNVLITDNGNTIYIIPRWVDEYEKQAGPIDAEPI